MQVGVLFVCLGNICRSPAAEGVMRKMLADSGLSARVRVDSAGTLQYHGGDPPDPRMRNAARRRGYDLNGRARGLIPQDLSTFDLIVAMDRDNYSGIQDVARSSGESGARIVLLSEYLSDEWPTDVPDPYYGGRRGFERVLDMLEAACPAILRSLTPHDEQPAPRH